MSPSSSTAAASPGGAAPRRRLIVHIGVQRTATTTLQSFLKANVPALAARGVLYPYGVARHKRLANRLFNGALDPLEAARDMTERADAREAATGRPIDALLISDEDICVRLDMAPFEAMREVFDLRVVYALRRQDLWLESWYLQNVKWQWNRHLRRLTFDQFLAEADRFAWIDYDARMRRIEAAFGTDAARPYVFETAAMPDGPVAAFAQAAGLDLAGLPTPPAHANASLSPRMTELLRRLPLHEAPPALRGKLVEAARAAEAEQSARLGPPPSRLLSPEKRAQILDRHAEGNAALARRRFGRDALFLDPPTDPAEPVADPRLPSDAEALLADYVAPLFRALIAQAQEQTPAAAPQPRMEVPLGVEDGRD
ncbi:MAG: hypothetical protein AAF763_04345 [Pseudomonadota bacterium]